MKIDSEQTTGVVAEFDASEITTGKGVQLTTTKLTTGDSLNIDGGTAATTGSAMVISQNSSSTSARNVVSVEQQNASSVPSGYGKQRFNNIAHTTENVLIATSITFSSNDLSSHKIRKGAFVSRVGDVDTKDMDYDALIRLFQTNVRPLTVEFKYMESKRPPPLESVKTNGTLSPPISPDVERKPEFSPRGT